MNTIVTKVLTASVLCESNVCMWFSCPVGWTGSDGSGRGLHAGSRAVEMEEEPQLEMGWPIRRIASPTYNIMRKGSQKGKDLLIESGK